jgi:hypothetical protein
MSFVPVDEPRHQSELRDLGRVRAPNIATSLHPTRQGRFPSGYNLLSLLDLGLGWFAKSRCPSIDKPCGAGLATLP